VPFPCQAEFSQDLQYSLQRSVVHSTSRTTIASFNYSSTAGEQKVMHTPVQRPVVNVNIHSTSEQFVRASKDQLDASQNGRFSTPSRPALEEKFGHTLLDSSVNSSGEAKAAKDATGVSSKPRSSALCEAACLLLPWMLLMFLLGTLLVAYVATLQYPGLFSAMWPPVVPTLPSSGDCLAPVEPLECLFCGGNTVI
jgi:hypothetical protein